MGLKQELNEEMVQGNCRLEIIIIIIIFLFDSIKRENIFAYTYIFAPFTLTSFYYLQQKLLDNKLH